MGNERDFPHIVWIFKKFQFGKTHKNCPKRALDSPPKQSPNELTYAHTNYYKQIHGYILFSRATLHYPFFILNLFLLCCFFYESSVSLALISFKITSWILFIFPLISDNIFKGGLNLTNGEESNSKKKNKIKPAAEKVKVNNIYKFFISKNYHHTRWIWN